MKEISRGSNVGAGADAAESAASIEPRDAVEQAKSVQPVFQAVLTRVSGKLGAGAVANQVEVWLTKPQALRGGEGVLADPTLACNHGLYPEMLACSLADQGHVRGCSFGQGLSRNFQFHAETHPSISEERQTGRLVGKVKGIASARLIGPVGFETSHQGTKNSGSDDMKCWHLSIVEKGGVSCVFLEYLGNEAECVFGGLSHHLEGGDHECMAQTLQQTKAKQHAPELEDEVTIVPDGAMVDGEVIFDPEQFGVGQLCQRQAECYRILWSASPRYESRHRTHGLYRFFAFRKTLYA